MRLAKALILMTVMAALSFPASAEAADRLVLGEMFTNWG